MSRSDAQALIGAAVLAPSSHNTQPWVFRLHDGTIDLLADRTRALPVNDPHDRELTISCGAALFNLRVAAAAAGLATRVELLPDAAEHDLLARARFVPAAAPLPLADLASAIPRRRTVRQRFAATPLDGPTMLALVAAAVDEGAVLHLLEDETKRQAAAALVAEGDAAQWADPHWRRELAAWMHPRRRRDGLVTTPTLALPLAQAVVRTFDMGPGVAAKDRDLADASPMLAVLATTGDDAAHWLAAGQALEHVLLTAVQHGLQASYLNQPVQVAALRPRLQQLTGHAGHAQLLLRLGVPLADVAAAPRRNWTEVAEIA